MPDPVPPSLVLVPSPPELRHLSRVRPRYIFLLLNLPTIREVMRSSAKRAVAQSSINQQDVSSLPLPLPSLEDQDEMIRVLSTVEEKLTAENDRATALDALFKVLLRDLMTGRVRVGDLDIPTAAGGGS